MGECGGEQVGRGKLVGDLQSSLTDNLDEAFGIYVALTGKIQKGGNGRA